VGGPVTDDWFTALLAAFAAPGAQLGYAPPSTLGDQRGAPAWEQWQQQQQLGAFGGSLGGALGGSLLGMQGGSYDQQQQALAQQAQYLPPSGLLQPLVRETERNRMREEYLIDELKKAREQIRTMKRVAPLPLSMDTNEPLANLTTTKTTYKRRVKLRPKGES